VEEESLNESDEFFMYVNGEFGGALRREIDAATKRHLIGDDEIGPSKIRGILGPLSRGEDPFAP